MSFSIYMFAEQSLGRWTDGQTDGQCASDAADLFPVDSQLSAMEHLKYSNDS